MSDEGLFLIVYGPHTSCEDPHEFLSLLVTDSLRCQARVEAVLVGSHLVGIVEFPQTPVGRYCRLSTQRTLYTNYRSRFTFEVTDVRSNALREFGAAVRAFAPGSFPGQAQTVELAAS